MYAQLSFTSVSHIGFRFRRVLSYIVFIVKYKNYKTVVGLSLNSLQPPWDIFFVFSDEIARRAVVGDNEHLARLRLGHAHTKLLCVFPNNLSEVTCTELTCYYILSKKYISVFCSSCIVLFSDLSRWS